LPFRAKTQNRRKVAKRIEADLGSRESLLLFSVLIASDKIAAYLIALDSEAGAPQGIIERHRTVLNQILNPHR
jgi:hypothetical protein